MANEIEFTTIGKPQIVLERSDETNLRLDLTDYSLFLREAKRNGWEPEGYVLVSNYEEGRFNSDIESDYLFPHVGWISDNDAKNIASALRKMETCAERFSNREVFQVEFYDFDEIRDYNLEDFLVSCSTASKVICSMGDFILLQPLNFADYLIKKYSLLMDFIGFCELGEFNFMQIINEWFGANIPHLKG
jgi:hypothetical protein